MDEPETTEGVDEPESGEFPAGDDIEPVRRPWWFRAGVVVLAAAVLVFLIPAFAHLFFPPINPRQTPPPGHLQTDCWACHDYSSSARILTFE